MKTLLLGNAGSGKSTLAARLVAREPAALLALDAVAFVDGSAERRPVADSVADALAFVRAHPSWIVEGCYADLLAPLLPHCDELIFLDPGVEACVAHCRARPWEPDKYASPEEQDRNLALLLDWVRSYETRTDEYGRAAHRALFDGFDGTKRVFTDPAEYAEG